MAATVTETRLDPQPESEPDSPMPAFFRLPAELRIQIYRLALVEPSPLQKRHHPMCLRASHDSERLEWPPWANKDSGLIRDRCPCSKRHSVNLMAVNRQIQNEAAPIFWSENQFVFVPFQTFVQNVGRNLRPKCRQLLRHLLFLDGIENLHSVPHYYRPPKTVNSDVEALWKILPQCSGLHSVALSYRLLSGQHHRYQQLRHSAPRLTSFRLVTLFSSCMESGANIDSPELPYDPELPLEPLSLNGIICALFLHRNPGALCLFFLFGRELALESLYTLHDRQTVLSDYAVDFQRHATSAITGPDSPMITRWDEATRHQQAETVTSQRAVPGSHAWFWRRQAQRLPRVGIDGSYSEVFRLDNGDDCEFQVFGLAPDEELRLINKRQLRREKKKLWHDGLVDFRRNLEELPVRPWHRDWLVRQRGEEEKRAQTQRRKAAQEQKEKKRLERDGKARMRWESQMELSETQLKERKRINRKNARDAEGGGEDGESSTYESGMSDGYSSQSYDIDSESSESSEAGNRRKADAKSERRAAAANRRRELKAQRTAEKEARRLTAAATTVSGNHRR